MSCNMTSLIVDCIPGLVCKKPIIHPYGMIFVGGCFSTDISCPTACKARTRFTLLQTPQNFHPLNKKCKKPAFQILSSLNLMTWP